MKNIYLIGFMGVGKSTIGRELAKKTKHKFIDIDRYIEAKEGMSITEIFELYGENEFRNMETNVLKEALKNETTIYSCGGGIIKSPKNIDIMKLNGRVYWLDLSAKSILNRVKRRNNRPILEGNKNIEFIKELLASRVESYRLAADKIINCNRKTVRMIVEEIMKDSELF